MPAGRHQVHQVGQGHRTAADRCGHRGLGNAPSERARSVTFIATACISPVRPGMPVVHWGHEHKTATDTRKFPRAGSIIHLAT